MENSGVYIDLGAALDVRRLPGVKELIQQSGYARLKRLLTERLEDLRKPGKPDEPKDDDGTSLFIDRRQNAIAIHGGRGTGKTTFVRNAFALLKEDKSLGDSIATLGVVDPTLIENKENVFVIVVNKIRDAVDRAYDNARAREKADEYEFWRQSLRELAGGLMLLDGIGAEEPLGEGWDDKQYILQRGLDKVRDAAGLEVKFHTFIERSLTFLKKECFLLAFDDVDTSFARGWPVLEVIRRYLTSRRWVSVVCGDLDLFAILVRGQQWANFEKKSLRYDDPNISSFRLMVDHLQGQYLLKVLRPDNRITLQPVAALTDRISVGWAPRNSAEENRGQPLKDYVDNLVQNGLKFGGRWERRLVGELLLRQPIRTVLQVLALGRPSDGAGGGGSDDMPARVARELPSVFIDALLRYNLSPDELREAGSTRLVPRLAQVLTDNRKWLVAHTLFPDHQDDNINLALLGLGAWVRQQFERSPHLAFEYFIRICLSQQVLGARQEGLRGPSEGPATDGISADAHAKFANFAELGQLTGATGVAGRIIAAIAAEPAREGPRFGIIPLYKRDAVRYPELVRRLYGFTPASPSATEAASEASAIKTFQDGVLEAYGSESPTTYTGTWFNTIDSLTGRLDPTSAVLASLPVSHVLRGTSERSAFFSVFRLVAILGRLVELATSSTSVSAADVAYALHSESRMLAFGVPPWTGWAAPYAPAETMVESDAPPDQGPDTLAKAPVVQQLVSWIPRAPDHKPPPPYVLARAWQRFHVTLTGIDEEIQSHQWFLGHLFHRHIIAFLNALLVEETLHQETIEVTTRNPLSDSRIFLRNLNLTATHLFFDFIWSCPLWGAFLDPGEKDLFEAYRRAAGVGAAPIWAATYTISAQRQTQFDNLYPVLNSIGVIGVNARPTEIGSGTPSTAGSRRRTAAGATATTSVAVDKRASP